MKCIFDGCRDKAEFLVSYDQAHHEDDHRMCKKHAESMRHLAESVTSMKEITDEETRSVVCATNLCKKFTRGRRG